MDRHFHYYATFLGARLAGMKQPECQQLAYYCQTMAEMHATGKARLAWHYQQQLFSPSVMGASEHQLNTHGRDYLGEHHCQLAFKRLPALTQNTTTMINPQMTPLATIPVPTKPVHTQQARRHYYNPLTDIDWQHGGQFKAAFSQKIAAESAVFDEPHPQAEFGSVNSELDSDFGEWSANHQQPSKLNCSANSEFSRSMLNDSIYKSRYHSPIKGIELALLGCRLFVYQNTWNSAQMASLMADDKHKRADILLDAFYWTMYAIKCYLQDCPMDNKLRKLPTSDALDAGLKKIFTMNGSLLKKEYSWLAGISELLTGHGHCSPSFLPNWREGLRYRPDYLIEQAMLAAGADSRLRIDDLQGFKASDFYKLNKAAKYHTNWLAGQLNHCGLSRYAHVQQKANQNMWQKNSKEL